MTEPQNPSAETFVDPAQPAAPPAADPGVEARLAEMTDAYLRARAEAENARRRADEEIAKARKFALEAFAESLLPVLDSLEAGVAQADATAEQTREGMRAVLAQFAAVLERNKVTEVNPAVAAKFDPNQHHAISVLPAPQEPNTIVSVLQKGYLISERVLRPALVTVSGSQ